MDFNNISRGFLAIVLFFAEIFIVMKCVKCVENYKMNINVKLRSNQDNSMNYRTLIKLVFAKLFLLAIVIISMIIVSAAIVRMLDLI
jgi:hypothetical protein